MKMNPVAWFEIYVEDIERARAFYCSVFGFMFEKIAPPVPGIEMMFFPMSEQSAGLYGAPGALVKDPMRKPSKEGTLVYFSSMDCAVEAARVAAAGGTVAQEKTSIGPYGFMALCLDTEGNSFGIHSMV
jgi:predicted enzyme related to lactoylglutathione lyase